MKFWRIEINWLNPQDNKVYLDDFKWPEEEPKKVKKATTRPKKTAPKKTTKVK